MREDKDISQAEMSVYLNVHQTTYSDYELGKLNIPVAIMIELANFHGTSTDYPVGRTDVERPYPESRSRN